MLMVNKTITLLSLSQCDIGDDGVCAITNALKTNTTLQELNLNGNYMRYLDEKMLKYCVVGLKLLDISSHIYNIDIGCMNVLVDGLIENQKNNNNALMQCNVSTNMENVKSCISLFSKKLHGQNIILNLYMRDTFHNVITMNMTMKSEFKDDINSLMFITNLNFYHNQNISNLNLYFDIIPHCDDLNVLFSNLSVLNIGLNKIGNLDDNIHLTV